MAWAPNPPNFFKQFTKTNLDHLEQLKKDRASSTENDVTALSVLKLPVELRYLVPPAPPASGDYRLFGTYRTTRDYLRPLSETDIPQLYPSSTAPESSADWTLDRQSYLKNLTRSILLSFLELVGMLSENSNEAGRKQKEIRDLYANALHVINEYRPHQARESLILRMEDEVERGRKEIEDVQKLKKRMEGLVSENDTLVMNGHGDGKMNGMNGVDGKEKRDLEVQRAIWDVLEREFPRQES
jgi:mediator of RNA polymerase II transcription subunit 7